MRRPRLFLLIMQKKIVWERIKLDFNLIPVAYFCAFQAEEKMVTMMSKEAQRENKFVHSNHVFVYAKSFLKCLNLNVSCKHLE